MARKMHKDQRKVLKILRKRKNASTNELIDRVGFSSVNHAYYHLTKLVEHGFLNKEIKGHNAFYARTGKKIEN